MEAAASGRFIPVGLELGGKDPAYVRADANLAHAIENLADGAFFNSGQSCCGIERIYAHASVYNEVVAGIAKLGSLYKLGNPLDPKTNLGPMIKPASADFVREQINHALAAGAVAHVDTSEFELDQHGSAYLSPQVLSNVDHSMSVMVEESFGPVVGIMQVQDDAEAIRLMNDSPYGLTAAIWTEDVEAAERIAAELQTGTVFMNRCDYLDPALAWTGVKDTGRGCTLSALGYEALTRPKSLHFRLNAH
jgi:acyl-CoA reductase-like NAD-dependent aldehyde dehydrogenase